MKNFMPYPDEITQILRHLQYSYVDPEKLEGYRIMRSALERLAFKVPNVVVYIPKKEKFSSAVFQVEESQKKFYFKQFRALGQCR